MGMLSTVASFAAGFAVGATTGKEPLRSLSSRWGGGGGANRVTSETPIRGLMTAEPETIELDATLTTAARLMATADIGDVIVIEEGSGRVAGIVTDRDIAVRAVAAGRDPDRTKVGEVFSRDLVAVAPTDSVGRVLDLMRGLKVRRQIGRASCRERV